MTLCSCAAQVPDTSAAGTEPAVMQSSGAVKPGITVLLEDSVHLIRGKRIGLLTNQTGRDASGRSDIDLLFSGQHATDAGARLVRLFSPEHGIRGTEDRENLKDSRDEKTGLPIISLYTAGTIAPPDSTLRDLDALVFDLQDIGTRTWTYVGNLVYALRAVKRAGIPLIVLDRPAPLTGRCCQGPMLDSALANPEESRPGRPGLAYALYPFPLRHGMTMGELARYYNDELGIGAKLHVAPLKGWHRNLWFDQTGLGWVRPSPNLPTLTGALLYPALVALEATNVSVGRGTPLAHERIGAPWMKHREMIRLLESRNLRGLRFEPDSFPANRYGSQQPYTGQTVPGVRIVVTNRDSVDVGRLGAAIVWALVRTSADSLQVNSRSFDLRWGKPGMREALLRGDDPDAVLSRDDVEVRAFRNRASRALLYGPVW
jgi:uncharacterized protein YbbC (DUF1343 family)